MLVGLSETEDAWLRDVRAAGMPWTNHLKIC